MILTDKIKKLLDESILFSAEQKEAWLKLLPQMTQNEMLELHGILSEEMQELKAEGVDVFEDSNLEKELLSTENNSSDHGASIEALRAANSPAANAAFAKELKREVETPELAGELAPSKPVAPKPVVATKLPPKPPAPPVSPKLAPMPKSLQVPRAPAHRAEQMPAGALRSLLEIRTVDDLKRIRAINLRQGELSAQLALIKAKILAIAQANKLLPFYAVTAFEESPLYKTYLQIGSAMILNSDEDRTQAFEKATANLGSETLTMREFEAIADLRKQIEQL